MAALKYCELADLDPKKLVRDETLFNQTTGFVHEQWESVAAMLKRHYMANLAIDYSLKWPFKKDGA